LNKLKYSVPLGPARFLCKQNAQSTTVRWSQCDSTTAKCDRLMVTVRKLDREVRQSNGDSVTARYWRYDVVLSPSYCRPFTIVVLYCHHITVALCTMGTTLTVGQYDGDNSIVRWTVTILLSCFSLVLSPSYCRAVPSRWRVVAIVLFFRSKRKRTDVEEIVIEQDTMPVTHILNMYEMKFRI
jgi:hypothetical protein